MHLTRHQTADGQRWAADGQFLPHHFELSLLLDLPSDKISALLENLQGDEPATGDLLAPIDAAQEVWASGVTYLRSREAREAESESRDVYEKVYDAERPELFAKAAGWRVRGPGAAIRVRADSQWNVPEPELTLVINTRSEIVGWCVGNDVSSRDIEGANPLYLPQAKVYNGSCALGPGITLAGADAMNDLPIELEITRGGEIIFSDSTRTSQIKRGLDELAGYLTRELDFPHGVFLMTGTGIVPDDDFTLKPGDSVRITIGERTLENPVS